MADCNFYDDCEPWTPKNNEFLTWDSAVRFYVSRTDKKIQTKTVLAEFVITTNENESD